MTMQNYSDLDRLIVAAKARELAERSSNGLDPVKTERPSEPVDTTRDSSGVAAMETIYGGSICLGTTPRGRSIIHEGLLNQD